MSPSRAVFAGAALSIAAIVAFVGWTAHEKRTQKRAIAELVGQGSAILARALEKTPSPEEVAAARRAADGLAATAASRQAALARAADQYLTGTRVIVQRRLETQQRLQQATASREALAQHVSGKARRDDAWIHRATELRRKADQEQADLERGLNALAELLESTAQSGALLAGQLGGAPVVPDAQLAAAARRAREDASRAGAELEQARRLAGR